MRRRTKIIAFILLVAAGSAAFWQRGQIREFYYSLNQPELPEAVSFVEKIQELEELEELEEPEVMVAEKITPEVIKTEPPAEEVPAELPAEPEEINLAVPFTSQAPLGNWELPFKEACEEASLYMVHAFYQGVLDEKIDAQRAVADLQTIVDYEIVLFSQYEDTTVAQTALLAEQMYGYSKVEILADPTVEQLKAHLAAGRPIIIPAAGRQLGNPYYTQPGPLYHMLVLRGYTKDGFITNDPGTRRGGAYFYKFDTIMNALHDWNGGDVENGAKVVIVIWPEN